MRITLKELITTDLGYCCEWFFFHHYRQNRFTPLIAARLGVSLRAVQKHKSAYRQGKLKCSNCSKCLLTELTLCSGPLTSSRSS